MEPQPRNDIYTVCAHCNTPCWPRWTRTEPGEYIGLCQVCRQAVEWDFTAENAILEALIIIGIRQGINRSAGAR